MSNETKPFSDEELAKLPDEISFITLDVKTSPFVHKIKRLLATLKECKQKERARLATQLRTDDMT